MERYRPGRMTRHGDYCHSRIDFEGKPQRTGGQATHGLLRHSLGDYYPIWFEGPLEQKGRQFLLHARHRAARGRGQRYLKLYLPSVIQ